MSVLGAALAGIAMQEAVLRVARAKLPLASASAAMVVVLEGREAADVPTALVAVMVKV